MNYEEGLVLGIVLVVTAVFFVTSGEYSHVIARTPRVAIYLSWLFIAAIVVQQFISEPKGGAGRESVTERLSDDQIDEQIDDVEASDPFGMNAEVRDDFAIGPVTVPIRIAAAGTMVVYLILGQYLGLFLASLLFVPMFGAVVRMEKKHIGIVLVVTVIALFAFQDILYVDLWNGLIDAPEVLS